MLLIRALLLWSIISLHVVGGAVVFRRLFPRESPWFGFIVPGLTLVLVMNFIEHLVAIPSLLWLLPFSTLGFLWALIHPKTDWKGLRLPTSIFLGAFAFTVAQHLLKPDIVAMRDGVVDLCLMSCFCGGETVPPTFNWNPPFHLSQYYVLGHYAISVLTRLFGLDIGTGFNLSSALLSAFDCVIAAAAAWVISRKRIWITILAAVLVECAATGATAYLWLTTQHFDPNRAMNLLMGKDAPTTSNPIWKWLQPSIWYDRRELMAPGTWSWLGSFHSTSGGQFLTLFSVWSLVELLRRRVSNWPWICLGAIPLLSLVTSTWAVPLEGLLLLGGLFWVWYYKLSPENFRFVVLGLVFITVLLTPMLLEFLTTAAILPSGWTDADSHTQVIEFLILWWPIYLPWFALIFFWPKLHPAVKTIIIVLPIAFLSMEFYTVGGRPDYTSKLWGYIYCIGWSALFPALAMRRAILLRCLTCLLLISSLFSFFAWSEYTWHTRKDRDIFHLEGTGSFRCDPLRGPLLSALSQMKGETVLTGKSSDMYCESPALAAFTGNRTYITWSYFCDSVAGANTYGEAQQREKEVNEIYDGKCNNPLLFLRTHAIAAIVVYPGDNISTDVITALKRQLAPYYEYSDFSDDSNINSGIFIFHPETMLWPTGVLSPLPFDFTSPSPNSTAGKP